MLTIACLLKVKHEGKPEFQPEHVARLQRQCAVIPHDRFVCLSDVDVPCERIPLSGAWPRWWGQLALFEPGLFTGPVLYFDLDTTILRDPGLVPAPGEFWALACPLHGTPTSGIMAWNGDFSAIYHGTPKRERRPARWVNEGIFPHVAPILIQDRLPGFYSYKRHVRGKALPADARVVYFHGQPRPWDIPEFKVAA